VLLLYLVFFSLLNIFLKNKQLQSLLISEGLAQNYFLLSMYCNLTPATIGFLVNTGVKYQFSFTIFNNSINTYIIC